MHTFTTERLIIRPIEEQDREFYCSLYMDEKIMRHIGPAFTREQANKAFDLTFKPSVKAKDFIKTWAIIDKSTSQSIGIQALSWKEPTTNNLFEQSSAPEIGIMLDRSSNGKLYPEEAMGALVEFCFKQTSSPQIKAQYFSSNFATKRFVKKLGFITEETNTKKPENISYEFIKPEMWTQNIIEKIY